MNDNDAIERLKWHSHFSDGWQSVESSTWTYVSASSFRVSGDQTAIFEKGRFLKWTQTTVKYGVVASSSYSSPNTTVTIIVNTDYTLANAAISSPFISYSANPQGWPGWFNYSPTLTGWSVNPTNAVYQFRVDGNMCQAVIRQNTPGTSSKTSTTLTAPITAATVTNGYWSGICASMDNGVLQTTAGLLGISSGGTVITAYRDFAFNTWTSTGNKYIVTGSIRYRI